jgi:hypothetical protein
VVIFLNFVLTIVEKQDVTNVVDLQFVLIIVKNQGVKNVKDNTIPEIEEYTKEEYEIV